VSEKATAAQPAKEPTAHDRKTEQTKGKTIYCEICQNGMMRVIELPAEVETDKVTATFTNGILELTLPKAAKAMGVHVEPRPCKVAASAGWLSERFAG
jgi:hypothetical protein